MTDIQEHLIRGDRVVVAFASGGGDFGGDLSHFEFGRSLQQMGIAHVLLRDSTERWYHEGISGLGDARVTVSYIRALRNRYKEVMTLGLSSGAYGALMYGQTTPVDRVIAISPITGLGRHVQDEVPDNLRHRVELPDHYGLKLDIQTLFGAGALPALQGFVSDGDGTELDAHMFERLIPGPRVQVDHEGGGWSRCYASSARHTLTMIPGFKHADLAKAMRDSGLLRRVIMGED